VFGGKPSEILEIPDIFCPPKSFAMACGQKMLMFGIFKACTSKFAYYKFYQRKLKVITRKKNALHFLTRPLDFSLEIREDESNLHESPPKNLETVSKN